MIEPVKRKKRLFSSRKKSTLSLLGIVLGLIAGSFTALTFCLAFWGEGAASIQYGAVFFLCTLIAAAGEVFSIISRFEPDTYSFYSYLGMVLNGLQLLTALLTVYRGMQ